MIERQDLFTIPFYKKTHFSGSYLGMRYRIEQFKRTEESEAPIKEGEEPKMITVLKVTVFPGPYCYDVVPEDEKVSTEFEFSDEGIDEACKWLNEQYETNTEKWSHCTI